MQERGWREHRSRSRWSVALAVVLLAMALAACGSSKSKIAAPNATTGPATTLQPVSIKMVIGQSTPPLYPIYIAQDKGFFAKFGLKVDVSIAGSDALGLAQLVSGNADVADMGTSTLVIAKATQGTSLVSAMSPYSGPGLFTVLRKPVADKLGVAADGPLDARVKALKGLAIAVPSKASALTTVLDKVTSAAGVSYKQVIMQAPAMIAAFQRGDIDGVQMVSPVVETAIQKNGGVMWLNGLKGDMAVGGVTETYPFMSVTIPRTYLDKNSDAAVRLTAALLYTSEWIKNNATDAEATAKARWGATIGDLWDQVWANNYPGYIKQPVPSDSGLKQIIATLPSDVVSADKAARLTATEFLDTSLLDKAKKLAADTK
ncbi:MAG: nitrate transporter substrate-binding protein [Acidimicrobiales bacterium]|jgi:NitT/TauT family transport system substrate-binding protein|nr:nitrate transporter substrate-binding protein [Acidimicrobiales bacterium]